MVRGNWQKRVETAEARRQQAKQQKQLQQRKQNCKVRVQELLQLLDRAQERIVQNQKRGRLRSRHRPLTLHLWSNCVPNDGPPLLDVLEPHDDYDEKRPRKGKARSGSFESSQPLEDILPSPKGRKQRGRSNSTAGSSNDINSHLPVGKKKVHPRSKQQQQEGVEQPTIGSSEMMSPLLFLCRSHFFHGTCAAAAGTDGCRYSHFSSSPYHKTLFSALTGGASLKQSSAATAIHSNGDGTNNYSYQHVLKLCDLAAPSLESHVDALELVYYQSITIHTEPALLEEHRPDEQPESVEKEEQQQQQEEEQQQQRTISDQVTSALTKSGIKLSNLVYMVINETLIFDSNQDDAMITCDEDMEALLSGGHVAATSTDPVGKEETVRKDTASEDDLSNHCSHLPGSILELILTFLPDAAVAAASRVCQAWYHEIGHHSPNLWRHLLERRKWPLPTLQPSTHVSNDSNENDTLHQIYRQAFLEHYSVFRDMAAIKLAMSVLTSSPLKRTAIVEEKEMVYQNFSTRKYAPAKPNTCVAVQVWSPNRILAAYYRDCSLRLFETVEKSSQEKICRELICQRVNPFKHTKRRHCSIVSMVLDEQVIGCLCHVLADVVDNEAFLLVVLTRDDYLMGKSSSATGETDEKLNDTPLQVIDIGEVVLGYVLSFNGADHDIHPLPELGTFFLQGGKVQEVQILASQTIIACGYGRFMVEISVSIPSMDEGMDGPLTLIARKLVLFSSSSGDVAWIGESINRPLDPRRGYLSMACTRKPDHSVGSQRRTDCSIAVTTVSSPAIHVVTVEPSGHVQDLQRIEESDLVWRENLSTGDRWELFVPHCRPLLITSTDIIASDVLCRRVDGRIQERKTFVSFYSRFPSASTDESHSSLTVDGDMVADRLVNLRDTHAVLICRKYDADHPVEPFDHSGDELIVLCAVIIHILSRKEIGRIIILSENIGLEWQDILEMAAWNDGTIGAAVSWKGIIMTGSDIRALGDHSTVIVDGSHDDSPMRASLKKKKKRQPNKGGKKDGFARGMSLRG